MSELADNEVRILEKLYRRGYLTYTELCTLREAIAEADRSGDLEERDLMANALAALADQVDAGSLSRADFDANKSEYLWQLKTESIAGSVYEIQEVTESDLKATGKTILYTAFSLASGELPESVGATIDLLVVEKESGAVVHQWKGITYRTELDELRSSIEQDLASLTVSEFRDKYTSC